MASLLAERGRRGNQARSAGAFGEGRTGRGPEPAEAPVTDTVTTLVIDAGVWVAAADVTDPQSERSRAFFSEVVAQGLRQAVRVGTRDFLRSGEALYAALAERMGGEVVSRDGALIERGGALTPEGWIARIDTERTAGNR